MNYKTLWSDIKFLLATCNVPYFTLILIKKKKENILTRKFYCAVAKHFTFLFSKFKKQLLLNLKRVKQLLFENKSSTS